MTVPLIISVIAIIIVSFVVFRFVKVKRQSSKINKHRFERVQPLYNKLESNEPVTIEFVLPYAENLLTRELTYQMLADHDKLYLFPEEYNTLIKGAESNLANWLEFPTELDACPDEIEHVKRVTFDFDGENNLVHYEVFKYRTFEPHWAAKDGWTLGVVGPYFDDSVPYDFPHNTFSRIGTTATPDEEAKWVHENISLKR